VIDVSWVPPLYMVVRDNINIYSLVFLLYLVLVTTMVYIIYHYGVSIFLDHLGRFGESAIIFSYYHKRRMNYQYKPRSVSYI